MGITYSEVFADDIYNGWGDIRQARDISLKVAKPLLDAGWIIHLDDFQIATSGNWTSTSNKHALVLKSPDNLFSIGFLTRSTSSGFYYLTIFLYRYANMPSSVSEIESKTRIKNTVHTLRPHPTNRSLAYTNTGLVELRGGGFLMYLCTSPFGITDRVDKPCFGILSVLHCSSGTTINNMIVDSVQYDATYNILTYYMTYCIDGKYKSEEITATSQICAGGVTGDFEIIIPAISNRGAFINKSVYKSTRNDPNMTTGQTILLDNKPYIVLYSDNIGCFLLAI